MTDAEKKRAEIVAWLRAQAACGCDGRHGWCNADLKEQVEFATRWHAVTESIRRA